MLDHYRTASEIVGQIMAVSVTWILSPKNGPPLIKYFIYDTSVKALVSLRLCADPHQTTPSPTPGLGQKVYIQLFQNMVMLHIKLNGFTNAATW